MDKGLPRLPRKPNLPDELVREDSLLGRLAQLTVEAVEQNLPNAPELAAVVQRLAKSICLHYQPDLVGSSPQIMCNSGYNNIPYMGRKCCDSGCRLSQVKVAGNRYFYTGGDGSVEESLVRQIFAADAANTGK